MTKPSLKILVVDDEPDIRGILRQNLEHLGYVADEAIDGQEGLEKARGETFGLIISDLMMPRLDGIRLLSQLREEQIDVPFILLTGFGNEDFARNALSLGAYDFLAKPFDPDHLKTLVEGVLNTSKVGVSSHRPYAYFENKLWDGMKMVEMQLLSENPNLAYDYRQGVIVTLIDQLTFAKTACQELKGSKKPKVELGYLFRVLREISMEAKAAGLLSLGAQAHLATDALVHLRSEPELLKSEYIELIQAFIENLGKSLNPLLSPKSPEGRLLMLESDLRKTRVLLQSAKKPR